MKSIFKNILAIVIGIVGGGTINMSIIMVSSSIISLPEGINPANIESLKDGIHLFEPKHFLFLSWLTP